MQRSGWWLVVYDIADPRRLRMVHYRMKQEGIAVQKSVFLARGDDSSIEQLLDRIAACMNLSEDDLRAYPISHPKHVWTNGPNPLAELPAVHFRAGGPGKTRRRSVKKSGGWLKRLWKAGR